MVLGESVLLVLGVHLVPLVVLSGDLAHLVLNFVFLK